MIPPYVDPAIRNQFPMTEQKPEDYIDVEATLINDGQRVIGYVPPPLEPPSTKNEQPTQ